MAYTSFIDHLDELTLDDLVALKRQWELRNEITDSLRSFRYSVRIGQAVESCSRKIVSDKDNYRKQENGLE